MNEAEIRKYAELMRELDLTGLEVTENGCVVRLERTLCIVEAMKLMNEIMAELDGEIVEVCVQNGQVVDFGCPLFRIKGQ